VPVFAPRRCEIVKTFANQINGVSLFGNAGSNSTRLRITTPYRAEEMSPVAVSSLVNSARVDDLRCCEPLKQPMAKSPPTA